jgi:hypothetical protein
MFVGDLSELPGWIALGVSLFLLGSDHGFMLSGAQQLQQKFTDAIKKSIPIVRFIKVYNSKKALNKNLSGWHAC